MKRSDATWTAARIVLTGAPGTGKTTLLNALHLRGYAVAGDSARAIIQARKRRSLSPRPPPQQFAAEVLRRDIERYNEHAGESGTVFFDRCIVDALGSLHDVAGLTNDELKAHLSAYPYHPQVFAAPPWEAIYVNDAERDHTFAHALRVHRLTLAWYRRCGYEVIEIPKVGVSERCAFVLHALGAAPG